MSWTKGLNCRQTSGYVTDGANDTYIINDGALSGEQYPTTRNGFTFGYTTTGTTDIDTRDRNSGVDARLAGMHFPATETDATVIRVDLPATGTYLVNLAMGEASFGHTSKVIIRDNGSALLTIGPTAYSGGHFIDATGTDYSTANWPGSNTPASLTFSSTIAEIVSGNSGDLTALAHVGFDQQATSFETLVGPRFSLAWRRGLAA